MRFKTNNKGEVMKAPSNRSSLTWFVGLAALFACSASACQSRHEAPSAPDQTTIVVRGSSNVFPLVETWAPGFSAAYPTYRIDVLDTGSDEGIEDLLAGRADVAMSARPMNAEEASIARSRNLEIRETEVSRMGIAVIVNASNPVSEMSFGQLAEVFSGAAPTWRAFGGPDEPIVIVRKVSGWSPDLFRDEILGDRGFAADAVVVDSKEDVVVEVENRPWSIGFTGLAEALPELARVSLIRLTNDRSGEDATYALSRPLYFYTVADSPSAQPFLEYVLGTEAQEQIREVGVFPAHRPGDGTP
jgi:phosphate transport system substrate-binding protein